MTGLVREQFITEELAILDERIRVAVPPEANCQETKTRVLCPQRLAAPAVGIHTLSGDPSELPVGPCAQPRCVLRRERRQEYAEEFSRLHSFELGHRHVA